MSESPKRTQLQHSYSVGILGDKYVGKTYLCHKLTGRIYQGYQETTSITQFQSPSQKTSKFLYKDNPRLDNSIIINIGSALQYDILVFLFKDCDSFTQLFQFFETIKQTLDSRQKHVRQYWSQPKKIIAVYSNFQSVIDVQVQQLFTLLIEEISQFCNKVIFQTFIWKRQQDNWKDLKLLIQKQPIPLSTNKKLSDISKQGEITTLVKQKEYKQGPYSEKKQDFKEKNLIKQQYPFPANKQILQGIQIKEIVNRASDENYRKSNKRQQIRRSFIADQNRKSSSSYSQTNKNNLFDNPRQSYDITKIEQQGNKYVQEKTENLGNYGLKSDDQSSKKVSEQANKKKLNKNNPKSQVQITKIQTKPESEFSKKIINKKKHKTAQTAAAGSFDLFDLFYLFHILQINQEQMEENKNFDSQLKSYFDNIKQSIKQEHVQYLKSHPQLRQIMNDFLSSCLLQQPDNVYDYAKNSLATSIIKKIQQDINLWFISGCSGVGKGTLINLLIDRNPNLFELSISYTTRRPRQGEVHGREYYFVNKQEFEREIEKNVFVEYCQVHGNYYGTHKGKLMDVMNRGKICILDIDVQGAQKIFKNDIACNYIFIDAPSFEALQQRLKKRGTETLDVIEKRLKNAKKEIEKGIQLTFYNHLTNDNLNTCYGNIAGYIQQHYKISIKKE